MTEEPKTTTAPPAPPTQKTSDDLEFFPTDEYLEPFIDPGMIHLMSEENLNSIKFVLYITHTKLTLYNVKKMMTTGRLMILNLQPQVSAGKARMKMTIGDQHVSAHLRFLFFPPYYWRYSLRV